jgi:hypothetical protein
VVHRPQRRVGDAEAEGAAQRLARQRDALQVRQVAPVGLDVRVADPVAGQWICASPIESSPRPSNRRLGS